jgi:hypothetical protein
LKIMTTYIESQSPEASIETSAKRSGVKAEQYDLALAWMAAAIAGALAIRFLPDAAWWRSLAPLAAMGSYLAFALTRARYSTPRVADSVYFMGFLWTLWALISVLLWHPQLKAQQLYVAFGYALVTTAAGMFARLSLLQFYRTLEDQEDQATDQIDDGIRRIAGELELTHASLVSLRSQGTGALTDWYERFVIASEAALLTMDDAGRRVVTEGERLQASTRSIADSVEKNAASLDASITGFAKRLEGIDVSPEVIRNRIALMLGSVDKTMESAANGIQKQLGAVEVVVKGLKTQVDVTRTAVQTVDADLKRVDGGIREVVRFVQAAVGEQR